MFLTKAIASPKQNYPESLGRPQCCENVHDQVFLFLPLPPLLDSSFPGTASSGCAEPLLGSAFQSSLHQTQGFLIIHHGNGRSGPSLVLPTEDTDICCFLSAFCCQRFTHLTAPAQELIDAMVCLRGPSKLGIRAFTRHQLLAECAPNSTDKRAAAMTPFHLSPPLNLRQEHGIYYAGTCVPKREDVAFISS